MFGKAATALTDLTEAPLRDLRLTVDRALNHTTDALSATAAAAAPVHKDAPQAEYLSAAAGHLVDAQRHLQQARAA